MISKILTRGLNIVIAAFFAGYAFADAFHGRDGETGVMISRAAVDTVTPKSGLSVGLKVIRIHEGNKITMAFMSSEKDLKDLDASAARLLIDGQSIPLKFKRYFDWTITDGIYPVYEIWFRELDQKVTAQILSSKVMGLQITTVSGAPVKRMLSATALADVKEVLAGAPAQK